MALRLISGLITIPQLCKTHVLIFVNDTLDKRSQKNLYDYRCFLKHCRLLAQGKKYGSPVNNLHFRHHTCWKV